MENLIAGDLTIEATRPTKELLHLKWKGKSNSRSPGALLGPYFLKTIEVAAREQISIEMHFEHLEHFNSSTITALIQFLQEMRKHAVKLTIVFDQSLKWQVTSFDALRVFQKPDGLLTFRARTPEPL